MHVRAKMCFVKSLHVCVNLKKGDLVHYLCCVPRLVRKGLSLVLSPSWWDMHEAVLTIAL